MVGRVSGVEAVSAPSAIPGAHAFRTDVVPAFLTGGLQVRATDTALPAAVDATLLRGAFLNPVTATLPVTVLGYLAAQTLCIADVSRRVYLGGHWFTVA